MAYTKQTWTDGTTSDPSKGTVITASKMEHIEDGIDELNQSLTDINIFGAGEELANNSDLNDISNGKYFTSSTNNALTISNRPDETSKHAFTVLQLRTTGNVNRCIQFFIYNQTVSPILFLRTKTDSDTWSSWYTVI